MKETINKKTKAAAFSEIFLIVSMIFAGAFIISEASVVSATQYTIKDGKILEIPDNYIFRGDGSQSVFTTRFEAEQALEGKWYSEGVGEFVPSSIKNNPPVTGNNPARAGGDNANVGVDKTGGGKDLGVMGTIGALLKGTYFSTPWVSSLAAAAIQASLWAGIAALGSELLGLEGGAANALINGAAVGGAVYSALLGYKAATIATAQASAVAALGPGATAAEIAAAKLAAAEGVGGVAGLSSLAIFGIGIAIVAIVFVIMYEETEEKMVSFVCEPWEAPIGGDDCGECNRDDIPCTEYRCKALGQACELVNEGTEKQACVHIDRDDATAPKITPWEEALNPVELRYTNHQTRPPSLGVRIVDSRTASQCIQPFTAFEFGLETDEPAKCAYSFNHTDSIEDMIEGFEEGSFKVYNHIVRMVLPNPNDDSVNLGPLLQNDGTFSMFIRCQDVNGNENADEFAVSYCVDESDATPPRIEGFSINSGSPIAFGADDVGIEVYTNEPSSCRWSVLDQSYDSMTNEMTCATSPRQINANLQYTCAGILTGVEDHKENKFYFACEDTKGNTMAEREELVLRGSQELNIIDTGPEEGTTITGSAGVVSVDLTVRTDDGSDEGIAVCYFSSVDDEDNYIKMFETDSYEHAQTLELGTGTYTYYYKCVDAGGNIARDSTTFDVFVDKNPPNVVRAYKHEPNSLKVVTNENAVCVYDITSCNYVFDEADNSMLNPTIDEKTEHLAEWNSGKTYYVKCRDEFGNEPNPNECSIIVKTI